jgi:hypothetical protein
MGIDAYYNGVNNCENQVIPPFQSGGIFFVMHVGTAHKTIDKPTCGISKTYIIPGESEKQAATSFLKWCRAVVDDIRSNMQQDDLNEVEWLIEVDTLDSRAIKAREIQKEIEEIEKKLDDDYVSDGWWYNRLARLRKEKAEILQPEEQIQSRFELIVEPVRELIAWLEAGWYTIEPIASDRPTPVSYFDDWRGFTAYLREK